MRAAERVILALDVDTEDQALALVEKLAGDISMFKVGMQLFHSAGPRVIRRIREHGLKVFVDSKFHDIPNTVAQAARVVTALGCSILDVHASGGSQMMRAAVEASRDEARRAQIPAPLVLSITVLTSINRSELETELLIGNMPVEEVVVKWALMSKAAGTDGIVCSPEEISAVRAACGPEFKIITPGIRPAWAGANDQKRTMTPKEAVALGADYIVIGRPITQSKDPVNAARMIISEMEG